jgi:hypothetical protein
MPEQPLKLRKSAASRATFEFLLLLSDIGHLPCQRTDTTVAFGAVSHLGTPIARSQSAEISEET